MFRPKTIASSLNPQFLIGICCFPTITDSVWPSESNFLLTLDNLGMLFRKI
ncbi:hypothetical protein V6Z12_A09G175000 [Gossypium hirsutum]